jgi:hypothetical protein
MKYRLFQRYKQGRSSLGRGLVLLSPEKQPETINGTAFLRVGAAVAFAVRCQACEEKRELSEARRVAERRVSLFVDRASS